MVAMLPTGARTPASSAIHRTLLPERRKQMATRRRQKLTQTTSRVSEAIDVALAARHRALLLTELRFFLQDKYLRRNGQPAERTLTIDGVRVPPRPDVVETLIGELLVGATLAKRHADS